MAGIKGKLTNPLLSVVMPVYNERDTIEGMIARVLAVPDIRIELIVVDDGSKDGTSEILRELQKKISLQAASETKRRQRDRRCASDSRKSRAISSSSRTPTPSTRPRNFRSSSS